MRKVHNASEGFKSECKFGSLINFKFKNWFPQHPIFNLKHPSIRVSLSFSDVEESEKVCKEYFDKCREICGNPVSIFEMYQEETHRNKEFIRSISEKSKENMKRWHGEYFLCFVVDFYRLFC